MQIGVFDVSSYYLNIYYYKTDSNNYDLYLLIGSYVDAVFVKMTEPLNFTYDGSTVSSYAGTIVDPIYSNSTNNITSGNLRPVTSNAVYAKLLGFISKDKLPYTTLTSGQNINNLKTEGVYQAGYDAIGNSLIGRPNENIYSSFLFVMIPKNNAVVQIIISCGTGNIYIRQANDLQADWKDWHKLSYTTIAPTT